MGRQSARKLWTEKLLGNSSRKSSSSGSHVMPTSARRFEGLVLGIDPSLRGTGLAVIQYAGQDNARLVFSKTLRFNANLSMYACLGGIAEAINKVITTYDVRHVAVEETIYVNNFRTSQIMGASRGAALGISAMNGKLICEYSPLSIKKAVVGIGRASKIQVAGIVKQILHLEKALAFDESDAAAVALCHAFTWRES